MTDATLQTFVGELATGMDEASGGFFVLELDADLDLRVPLPHVAVVSKSHGGDRRLAPVTETERWIALAAVAVVFAVACSLPWGWWRDCFSG